MLGWRTRTQPPVGWTALLEIFLQAPEPLSRKLWHLYEPQCPLMTRYLLTNALDEGFGAPAERVLQVITPQLLLRLTLELSPEQCGRVRDHAIVALEARILDFMQYKERTPWYA